MEGLGQLQDAMQRDLAWRKREISDLRSMALRVDDAAEYVFRSGQVLLCAHWEGFLKKSAKLYIEHIFSQDIKLIDCAPHVVSLAYYDDVIQAAAARYPGSEENHLRLAKRIVATLNERIGGRSWNVDTEGNPGSDVLARILNSIGIDAQLGMDSAVWATTKVFINEHLVRDRHRIAHGEGTPIGKVGFLERSDRLLGLLDIVNDQLVDAAQAKTYRVAV